MSRRTAAAVCALALSALAASRAEAGSPTWVSKGSRVWIGAYPGNYGDAGPNTASFAAFNGGPTIGNVSLQLIFFGTEYADGTASPSQDQLVAGVQTVLASPYLADMGQYGMQTYSLRGVTTVNADPAAVFDSDAAGAKVWDLIEAGVFPEPVDPGGRILYLVFMPSNARYNDSSVIGAHKDPWKVDDDDLDGIQYAWVAWVQHGNLDTMIRVFTHELVETISDPESHDQAWLMDRKYNGDGNEIGDACLNTQDRLNGVWVQSYWSNTWNACVIPYPAPPTLNPGFVGFVSPYGGDLIRLTGTNFDTHGNTQVQFNDGSGWVNALSVSCPDANDCDVVVPGGNGTGDIQLLVNHFTATLPQGIAWSPSVSGLSSHSGKIGDVVTIYGMGFGTTVYFGSRPATLNCYGVVGGCQAVVPPGAGAVDVRIVLNGVWSRATSADLFTYDLPVITYLSPASGPMWGGTSIGISGQGFDPLDDGGMQLLFGGVPAASVSCYQSTSCLAITPQVPTSGPAKVTVRVYGVESDVASAPVFNFDPYPILTDFYVDSISQTGAVMLDGNAPPGGALVRLHSTDEAVVHVPRHVIVPAGSSSASFKVEFIPSPVAVTVHLRASYRGVVLRQGPYFIGASPPLELLFTDPLVNSTTGTTGLVQLLHRAPAGGATIHLVADLGGLSFPSSVTIPAGQYSTTFPVGDAGGTPRTRVTVTARYHTLRASASILIGIDLPPTCTGTTCI